MKICQRDIISSSSLKLKVKENESVSHSVMSDSLQLHGLQPTKLLCPWNSVGKNTGVASHSLLQRIFPTQGSSPGLLHCRQILCHLIHQGSPPNINHVTNLSTTFYFVCQYCYFQGEKVEEGGEDKSKKCTWLLTFCNGKVPGAGILHRVHIAY